MKKLLLTSALIVLLCLILLGLNSGCGKKPQYTLTIGVEGNGTGTLQPAPGKHSYEENTVVTLKATPATGSLFVQWGGTDGASVSNANTIVMNGNKSVKAVFSKLTYPLTTAVSPEGVGTVTTALVTKAVNDYEHGQTVRLTATPTTAGYLFTHWSGDLTGTDNPAQLLIDSTKSVTANFAEAKMEVVAHPVESIAKLPLNGAPTVKVSKTDGTPIPNIIVNVVDTQGQPFQGTKTVQTNDAGLAVFDNLRFYEGIYKLKFTVDNLSNVESNVFAVYMAGAGDADEPYLIHNLWGLISIENHPAACFRIENDIDASATEDLSYSSGKGWVPIGQFDPSILFSGQLDGNNKTISNLFINRPNEDYVGLFKAISTTTNPKVIIKDLSLTNVCIVGRNFVGGLIGGMLAEDMSLIENCSVTGTITGVNSIGGITGTLRGEVTNCHTDATISGLLDGWYIGGLGGNAIGATIDNSYALGRVTGQYNVGGLLGKAEACSITQCYAFSDVDSLPEASDSASIGGFVGMIQTGSAAVDCYSRGNVNGKSSTGGFCGYLSESSLIRCYSTGAVTASEFYGGLVGYKLGATATTNCYYDSDTSGCTDTGNGEPMTTAEMQDSSNYGGWDFEAVWNINPAINNGYPYLRNTPTE